MKPYSSRIVVFLFSMAIFYGCSMLKKKDFDPDNIEWKEITPAWGVPLVNSRMTIADAVTKNKSDLIISVDPDDDSFITFIYLDTVISPKGSELLDKLNGPNKDYFFRERNTLGTDVAAVISLAPVGEKKTLPTINTKIPFTIDSVKSLSEVKLKDGLLNITATSRIRHNVSMTLSFPDILSPTGIALTQTVSLLHTRNQQTTFVRIPPINLDGYTIKTASPNEVRYSLSAAVEVLNNDSPPNINVTTPIDSLNFTLSFESLGFKHVIGEFYPMQIPAIPNGSTNINVFDNALTGDIYFSRPQVTFQFLNSFGVVPYLQIDKAKMYYSYDTSKTSTFAQPLVTFPNPNPNGLNIPGITELKAPSISDLRDGNYEEPTTFPIDTTNSTLRNVLSGAPYRFDYSVPYVGLRTPTNQQAFIADESQLKIHTEVKIPMEGRINNLVITDTVKEFDLPKPDYVDYVEFRAGSINSIPFSIEIQGYFLDSLDQLIDSLVVYPDSKQIVGPGQPEDFADLNKQVIKRTSAASYNSVIHVPNERYRKIYRAKKLVIVGRMHSLASDAAPPKSVKFYAWQECTFKLSIFARLRLDITDPEAVLDLEKK